MSSSSSSISSLPTNPKAILSQQDIILANHIFGTADSNVNRDSLANSLKAPLIVALIVAFTSHPISNDIISKFYPKASENDYIMIAIKMVLAAVVFFFLKNWSLVRS